MKILLVRNCSSEREGSEWPLPDVSLSEKGTQEASMLAKKLEQMLEQAKSGGGVGKVAIFASDHVRAIRSDRRINDGQETI